MENSSFSMEQNATQAGTSSDEASKHSSNEFPSSHKRSHSGGLLSKLSFLRSSADENHSPTDRLSMNTEFTPGDDHISTKKSSRAMAVAVQQQKTRRRKGSLRKAALLGRGAQRDRKEMRTSPLETSHHSVFGGEQSLSPTSPEEMPLSNGFGLGISEAQRSTNGYGSRNNPSLSPIRTLPMGSDDHHVTSSNVATSPTLTYTSTTDEDDILSIPSHSLPGPRGGLASSGSDSYFPPVAGSLTRRRSAQKAKSPLSIAGLATSPLPVPDSEWDYSETEWWGWVVLIVTWVVFVTGMGSCLGVWSWAWDVGETPYAPPELEDDPTLPIVGYYPALIILTSVMAWVWVVVAWVGMKYFRHAKISGD